MSYMCTHRTPTCSSSSQSVHSYPVVRPVSRFASIDTVYIYLIKSATLGSGVRSGGIKLWCGGGVFQHFTNGGEIRRFANDICLMSPTHWTCISVRNCGHTLFRRYRRNDRAPLIGRIIQNMRNLSTQFTSLTIATLRFRRGLQFFAPKCQISGKNGISKINLTENMYRTYLVMSALDASCWGDKIKP